MEDFHRDAQAATENTRVVRILVRQADNGTSAIGPTLATTRLASLIQNVSLVFADIKPALDSWNAARAKMIAAQVEPLVKPVNLSIVASMQPALDNWHATHSKLFATLSRSVSLGLLASTQPVNRKLHAQLEVIAKQRPGGSG